MRRVQTTEFVGGVPFTRIEYEPLPGGRVDFDGGCRQPPPAPPRIEWQRDPDDRTRWNATIVDRKW